MTIRRHFTAEVAREDAKFEKNAEGINAASLFLRNYCTQRIPSALGSAAFAG